MPELRNWWVRAEDEVGKKLFSKGGPICKSEGMVLSLLQLVDGKPVEVLKITCAVTSPDDSNIKLIATVEAVLGQNTGIQIETDVSKIIGASDPDRVITAGVVEITSFREAQFEESLPRPFEFKEENYPPFTAMHNRDEQCVVIRDGQCNETARIPWEKIAGEVNHIDNYRELKKSLIEDSMFTPEELGLVSKKE